MARILPPEIIREIYGYIYAPMRLHKLNDFPWHLGQICASWRSIFHSMVSNFWNRLDIDLNAIYKYGDSELVLHRYDVMLLALRYFLDHTKGQPLSFQFEARKRCPAEEDERMIRLFELLVAESFRWREINIRLVSSLLPMLYKAKHHMPLLSSAQLIGVSYVANPQHIHDLFEDVPHLTRLELGPFPNWRVNWASLSVLKLTRGYEYDDELLSILGQAKNLEKLAIYESPEDAPYLDEITSPISFPNLKVLSITIVDAELLPLLQTPSLEELYIKGLDEFEELDRSRNQVISFLTGSSCQLRCLGIAGCGADFLTDILRCTPDLLHLNLGQDNCKDMLDYFNQLAFHHHGIRPLACHLRSLMVIDPGFSFMEIMELAVLLASRTERVEDSSGIAPVEKLQKLMIITSFKGELVQYNNRTAVQTLRQQCAEHGVEFTVQHACDIPLSYYDNTSILDW